MAQQGTTERPGRPTPAEVPATASDADVSATGDEPVTAAEAAGGDRDVVDEVASQGVKGDASRAREALEWFMSDEVGETEETPTYRLILNVSTDPDVERVVDWFVRPIASTRIDELRRNYTLQQAGGRRSRQRNEAQVDIAKFNAALVYEATVTPDLREVARKKQATSGADLVLWRFRNKPLLVDQIAGMILQYSGADEDDLREAREVIAAKN